MMQSAGVRKRLSEPFDHGSLVLSLPRKGLAPWWSVSASWALYRQRAYIHAFVTSKGMAGEVGPGKILPCGSVCTCSWVCICASITIPAFPPPWRIFAICGAAFTFFTRHK